MGQTIIIRVPPDYLDGLWPVVSLRIEVALRHAQGELNVADVLELAKKGEAQVWTINGKDSKQLYGVAVTQVVNYPQMRAVRIVTLGGHSLDKWARNLNDAIEDFAREHGARRLEAFGRKGLVKMLEELAFRPAYVALVKEVET